MGVLTGHRKRTVRRNRFDITRDYWDDPYGRSFYSEKVNANPQGNALSSLLDNGMHAPVLDVDQELTCQPVADGTRVHVAQWGKASGWITRLHLDTLVSQGLLQSWSMHRDLLGLRRRLTVTFPYTVHALPSRSRGHYHLLCQTQLTWEQARTLASKLGAVEFSDWRHAKISGRGDFQFVYTANTDYDAF